MFTITYTNDANGTNLTLTTTDANLVVDVVTQLECHIDDEPVALAVQATTTPAPTAAVETILIAKPEEVEPNRDLHPISLRRWTQHHYQRVSELTWEELFELQTTLVRNGLIRKECTESSVRTYHGQAGARALSES